VPQADVSVLRAGRRGSRGPHGGSSRCSQRRCRMAGIPWVCLPGARSDGQLAIAVRRVPGLCRSSCGRPGKTSWCRRTRAGRRSRRCAGCPAEVVPGQVLPGRHRALSTPRPPGHRRPAPAATGSPTSATPEPPAPPPGRWRRPRSAQLPLTAPARGGPTRPRSAHPIWIPHDPGITPRGGCHQPRNLRDHADGAAILQLVQSGKPVTIGPLDRPRQQPAVSDVAFGTPLRAIWLTSERTEGFQ
jgi:hypothetical protein